MCWMLYMHVFVTWFCHHLCVSRLTAPPPVQSLQPHTYIHAHAGEWAVQNLPADVLDCGDPISSCVPLSKKRELFYISPGGKKGEILTAIELTQVLRGLPHIILDWVCFFFVCFFLMNLRVIYCQIWWGRWDKILSDNCV